MPGVVLLLALALLLVPFAADAPAAVKFKIKGRGFGHGVGMPQWGAYGQAKDGRGHRRILRSYFRDTRIGKAKSRRIRVLLSVRSSAVRFSGAQRSCGRRLNPSRTYRARISRNGRKVRLERGGRKIKSCGRRLGAKPKRRIRVKGDGTYRGRLIVRPSSGDLNVINKLGLEPYLKGVVPNEVPAGWPNAALRAQAVAARSYALTTRLNANGFDAYDDTRSQVYGGAGSEERSTNTAVRKTRRQVVKHNGKVAQTFFFSSSGGRTENSEYGFSGGSSRPYLKSVKDPWDKGSPYNRWRLSYSRRELQSALGDYCSGRLRNVRVTKTGASPRIVRAKVVCTGGKRGVSGDDLRFRLGLRSTWARFVKKR